MRHLRPRLLALLLTASLGLGASGCAGLATLSAAVPTVLEGISDATLIISQIESFVGSFFRSHPNPTQQAQIDSAITTVRDALIVAERTLAGATDVTSKDVAGAFANFASAYDALMKMVGTIGVSTAPVHAVTALGAGPGARYYVPEPRLLHMHAELLARRAR